MKQKQKHPATDTKMVQARLPKDLARRIKVHCAAGEISLAAFLAAACERAMEVRP